MAYVVPDQDHCLRASKLSNFAVWVEINGQAVPVYSKTESEDQKTVTCYIESEEGKQFVVRCVDFRSFHPKDSYYVEVCVDGEYCDGLFTRSTSRLFDSGVNDSLRFETFSGKKTSQTTLHPLLFSKLLLTDDDGIVCTDEHTVESLGSIKLVYHRISNIREYSTGEKFGSASTKQFDEKAKNAQLSHQATYGAPVTQQARSRSTFTLIDGEKDPLQIFEFRYRSRQLLQLGKHLPDSPVLSPQSSPSPEYLNALARDAEIARLQRQLDALKKASASASPGPSGIRKIKSEGEDGGANKRVKKEKKEVSLSSVGKGKEKEVIVLSDSD